MSALPDWAEMGAPPPDPEQLPFGIVVWVPKYERGHFWEAVDPRAYEWWTLAKRPSKLKPKDYIYFQIDDAIVARAKIHEITGDDRDCETTGRRWRGCHVVWRDQNFEIARRPRGTRATRGFAYIGERP